MPARWPDDEAGQRALGRRHGVTAAPEVPATGQRPLSDIRVLDLTIALSGPLCTLILAGLGAEVVRIEPPGGREMGRFNPPFLGRGGLHFGSATEPDDIAISVINRTRNKKSMTLDLKSDRGHAIFLDLARRCDVVVQNFSDGTADRLGVGYRDVRKVNPAAVYCSLSGLGEDNDQPELKAMDIIIQALSGIMQVTGEPDGPPTRVGVPVGDMVASLYAANGIMAALWARQRTQRGQHVDISLLDSLASLVAEEHFDVFEREGFPVRSGNFLNRLAPFGAYRAKDGYVAVAATADHWTHAIFDAMGRAELASDPRFATRGPRVMHADELNALIEGWTAALTTEEVVHELLGKRGVPAARVRTPGEAMADPRLHARGAVVPLRHPTAPTGETLYGIGLPIRMSESETGLDGPAPMLGEHNAEILKSWLGFDDEQVSDLVRERIM
jgi:crotonobetainyl-CoA:carnitine CoA-transferase CaiB-like acyl-CoA transferase